MSDVSIIAGGPSVPPPLPNGDGQTVTVADPIGALISTDLGTDTTIVLEEQLATGAYPVGTPLYPNANGTHFTAANAAAIATAVAVGLATAPTAVGGPVSIRDRGLMKLTTAQWDALVTGESGGLTPGVNYYVSAAAAGKLVTAAPTGSSTGMKVGTAVNATTMWIGMSLTSIGSS